MAFVEEKLLNADDADRLLKWTLEAKALRIQLQQSKDEDTLEAWEDLNTKILDSLGTMQKRFKRQVDIDTAESISTTYSKYRQLVLDYLKTGNASLTPKITRAGVESMGYMEAIWEGQREQLHAHSRSRRGP